MQEFHWRSSRLGVVSQGFVRLCPVHSRTAACEAPRAGTGTAHRERSHPGRAVHSEHTSEAQDNKEV